ncbi:diacylglycerol/lipid kinase family protein [Erythrobacter sp. MTPC3]|uniref:diacylglycerol/lipid kinase family protein n=1 Tax=Erythrobacter sp. MTPC3 TaxID=3056564 RepID=UPI0036F3BB2B
MATPIYEFGQMPRHAATTAPGSTRRPSRETARKAGEAPCVGVIYNPRSHGNQGADFDCGVSPHVHIAKPGDRSQLPTALTEFAERGIDLLVINGGDGTVRDVLTCGAAIFGDNWPAIAVLPKGKTNALTVDLGVPADWTLQDAIDALDSGSRVRRRPIEISTKADAERGHAGSRVLGFILGAGAFTKATQAGQSAHRLGAFNSLAVGVTTAWTIAQALFAGAENPWRKGSRMRIELGAQRTAMAHSGRGDTEYRQLLFASTLERLPAGTRPFGKLKAGLKLVALDQISRRTAALLPLAIMGREVANLRERGIHQLSAPEFTLEIDDQFILDGEAFPAGEYRIGQGPELHFVAP